MKTIELRSWEEFERAIDGEYNEITEAKKETEKYTYFSEPLFRGHHDANWKLTTTLERFLEAQGLDPEYSWRDYYNILERVLPAISSLTTQKHTLPEYKFKQSHPTPPGYPLMVYMRHHGFPSPLLDWTRSPYVAAFFAFNSLHKKSEVAIFSFAEYRGKGKIGELTGYRIEGLGPYVPTHRRHYLQQCEYTICFKLKDHDYYYCPHQSARFSEDQDVLKKYTLPYSERDKVLKKLDFMNINAFSLFGNEEGLMDWLAYHEIEKRLGEK